MRLHDVHNSRTHINNPMEGHEMMSWAKFNLLSLLKDLVGLKYHVYQKFHPCH